MDPVTRVRTFSAPPRVMTAYRCTAGVKRSHATHTLLKYAYQTLPYVQKAWLTRVNSWYSGSESRPHCKSSCEEQPGSDHKFEHTTLFFDQLRRKL